MIRRWTTPDDLAGRVRRRWDDGSLLRAYARGKPFPAIDVPVRGPTASEIGDDLTSVREWVGRLDAGRRDDRRYELIWAEIGGRDFGRNRVPARAVLTGYDQAWALLGVVSDVRRFDALLAAVAERQNVLDWVTAHPLQGIDPSLDWPRLITAYDWLDRHRGSGRYLREISAPGVDTKFAERHRPLLAALLAVPSTSAGFLAGLGLHGKPEMIRIRASPGLGLPAPMSELALRVDELAEFPIRPRIALVLENEITYLSVDVPRGGVVIWGKGFDVDRVGRLRWLASADVVYWGDLDTHGFAILDRLRAWWPDARSVLMDRETLMTHGDRWVLEDRPASSRLTRLSPDEAELYGDLVADRLGDNVRLEQECIDWAWATRRLAPALE